MQHLHHHENPADPNLHTSTCISQMAAVGLPHHQIAFLINIGIRTLLKFYAQELETAAAQANLQVLRTLFQLAKSGKNPAVTMFWAKARCGFQTTPQSSKPAKFDAYDPDRILPIVTVTDHNGKVLDSFDPNSLPRVRP